MKLGLVLPAYHPTVLVELAVGAAEAAGVDSLWVFDHLLGPFPPQVWEDIPMSGFLPDPDALMDPYALCGWLAHKTRLPLGISVTDSIRRAAPDVARSALTLQNLCPGGFQVGIGSGERENLTPFGYPFTGRLAATEHFLKTLRHILDTGVMPEGPGRFGYPTAAAAGKPGVWVGAHGPRMLELAGRYADGWLPVEITSPQQYRELKSRVAEHAAAAGRPEPESGLYVFVVLGESRARLREMFEATPAAKLLALFMANAGDWRDAGVQHPLGDASRGYIDYLPHEIDAATLRRIAPTIPFGVLESKVYLGNAAEVAARLRPYAEAGLEHVIFVNLTGLAGGLAEAEKHGPEIAALVENLRH